MTLTVQEVMDRLIEPVGRLDRTADILRFGDPCMVVTGIVTAFMATHEVIEQAVAWGANLIITHEGTFYSHQDRTDWLEQDPVYLAKRGLIESSGIAIFRFHDYWHRYRPDGIMEGLIQALDWSSYVEEHQSVATLVTLPETSMRQVAEHLKTALDIPFVRVAGDDRMTCTRIGLLVGYRGGASSAIPLFDRERVDLIIAGEGPEWETPEYVKDAVHQGRSKALIMLGHAESEEPGMNLLAERMKIMFPFIPIHFIPVKRTFQVI